MKKKKTVIGITIAVLAVCVVVLAVVFGVRAARKDPTTEHMHSFEYDEMIWSWEGAQGAQASVFCACGEEMRYDAIVTQTPLTPATCEVAGETLFTAKITINGREYCNEKQFEVPALGHKYDDSALTWSWEEDPVTAKACMTCLRDDSHVLWLSPETEQEILVQPDCESEGSASYTARVTANGKTYTDAVLRKIPALGHDYLSDFQWESDHAAATLQLSCKRGCGKTHSERVEANFTHTDPNCEIPGADTYTAKTTYDGREFSEAFVRSIPATGHDYDYQTLEWRWEGRTAKAIVKCRRNENHILQGETEIEEVILTEPSCEEAGEGSYTAIFRREGRVFTDTQTLPVPASGHAYDYSAAVWEWEGTQAASATVICTRNPAHTQTLPARITANVTEAPSCTQAGVAEYTATVTDGEGKAYTDTIRTEAPAGAHTYAQAEFWSNDTHELVCTRCGHAEYQEHENDENKICTLCGKSTWLYYGSGGLTVTVSAYPNEGAEYDGSIKKIVIPGRYYYNGLTATVYEVHNFQNCDGLESVVVSDGVKQISANAFTDCTALKEITVPNEFISIGTHAFSGCISLTEFVFPKNLTLIMGYVFLNCVALTKVTLPDELQSMGTSVFQGCSALKEINLPSTLTSIGQDAFLNCYLLSIDNLPSSLQIIGNNAFYGCRSLTKITIPGGVREICMGAFSGCRGLTDVTFESGVEAIGDFAFYGCTKLKNLSFGASIESIGTNAFYGCSTLEKIQLPSGLKSIKQYAFSYCTALEQVELPSGLKTIELYAFWNCTALKGIYIPRSVETMGVGVFDGTENLTIYCEAATKPSGWEESWNGDGLVYWAYEPVDDEASRSLDSF